MGHQGRGMLVALVLLAGTNQAHAFEIQSGFGTGCHERASVDTFRAFATTPTAPNFQLPADGAWQTLSTELRQNFGLRAGELSIAAEYLLFSLVVGVRAPDTDGHSTTNLERLRALHADPRPEGQYAHALRAMGDDGPEGDAAAVAGTKAMVVDLLNEAVATAVLPGPERNGRARLTLDFYNSFHVDVDKSAFALGKALHALQDSFSHSIRSAQDDHRVILHVLNFIEAISNDFDEHRDGIAHSAHSDRCDQADVIPVFTAATTASKELLGAFLSQSRGEDPTAIAGFADRWFAYQPGCNPDNDFCGNAERLATVRKDPSKPFLPSVFGCAVKSPGQDPGAASLGWLCIGVFLGLVHRFFRSFCNEMWLRFFP